MSEQDCNGCGYFNEGILEELCSHPLETYNGYPSCFTDESMFHVNSDGYWVLKEEDGKSITRSYDGGKYEAIKE
jgi:hypothetical protein